MHAYVYAAAAACCCCAYACSRRRRRRVRRCDVRTCTRTRAVANGAGVLQLLLVAGVAPAVRSVASGRGISQIGALASGAIGMVRAYRDEELRDWLRPVWGDATRAVFGAAAMFACAYGFAKLNAGGPRESWLARIYLQLGDPSALRSHMVVIAIAIIVVAAAEEITD